MSGIAPEINGHEPPCPERSEDLQSPRKIPLGRRCGKMGGRTKRASRPDRKSKKMISYDRRTDCRPGVPSLIERRMR